ncbi:MAG: hypothetical protein ACQESB_06750 [Elusimicrobiota bacterium]
MIFRNRILNVISLGLTFSLLCARGLYAEKGLQQMRIPVFARAEGMGGAYTAVAQEVGAIFYNPAGLAAGEERYDFHFAGGYADWVEGTQKTSAVLILPSELLESVYVKAFSIDYFTAGDLYRYNDAGERMGDLAYDDTALGINLGHTVNDFSFGANVKYLSETISTHKGSGFSMDLGALYSVDENMKVGAAFKNLGSFSLEDISVKMPTSFRIGSAYEVKDSFIMGIDLEKHGNGTNFHVGTELNIFQEFKVRAGGTSAKGGNTYSMGAGFNTVDPEYSEWGGQVIINYSFTGGGNLNVVNHRFDTGIRFGI